MFHFYKFLGSLSEPLNLFAVLLLLAAFTALSKNEKRQKIGRVSCLVLALFLFALALFPIGQWALLPLENRYAPRYPAKVDGIIMLTGDENPLLSEARGVPIAGNAGQRHMFLARLAKRYPKAKLIAVGNTGVLYGSKKATTQTVLKEIFDGIGISGKRIDYEPHSRTTHENATFTKQLVKPKKGQTWLLLTSAFHMPRSVLCFEKEGWKVVPVPSDYFTYPKPLGPHSLNLATQIRLLTLAAHEYIGLASYWAAGWIKKPW